MSNKGKIILSAVLLVLCVPFVFPTWWMVTSSLKPVGDIFSFPPDLLPANATVDAYGQVDELNAAIGVARAEGLGAMDLLAGAIQDQLFTVGAVLATPGPFTLARERRASLKRRATAAAPSGSSKMGRDL